LGATQKEKADSFLKVKRKTPMLKRQGRTAHTILTKGETGGKEPGRPRYQVHSRKELQIEKKTSQ